MNLALKSLPRRKQAERSALSDQRMLDAAVRLIVEKGSAGTTLKDVGEMAGYSRGLASARFGNKGALSAFIVRAVGEEWLAALGAAVKDTVGLAAICAALDAHFKFVSEGTDRIRAFYSLWFDSIGPDAGLKQVIANVHERRQRDVEAWIRGGILQGEIPANVPVASIAQQFCAAVIGIVYQWLVRPEATDAIRQLHEGLKQQMTLALSAGSPGGTAP